MSGIKEVLIGAFRILPLRKAVVLESHPDFSDNTWEVYQELRKRPELKKYHFYWLLNKHDAVVPELDSRTSVVYRHARNIWEDIRRIFLLNTSKYIIDSNSFVKKRRKNQFRIHLGHGMPIKIALDYSRAFGECEKYLVHSPYWKEIYTKQIHVPEELLWYVGYPRNDVLVNRKENALWKDSVKRYDKVIAWMPTYRQHRDHMDRAMGNQYPYGMPCVHNRSELEKLHECLKSHGILLLFRPHPAQELSVFETYHFSNIKIADDRYLQKYQMSLYEMLSHTQGLITDYSSVYFDYLLTDQPIALTIEDLEQYFRHFTLAFEDYRSEVKGEYVESFTKVLEFLENVAEGKDPMKTQRMEAKNRFHSIQDGTSTKRIVDYLVEKMP